MWLTSLLGVTGLLYLWGLGASGWANAFYSAAAQAGSESWKAFFFGSSDMAGSITVDKPPLSLWVMGLSVRIFGLSSWSILVPEALMGVATVALIYVTVRRVTGSPAAGLLAGAITATTPVAVLMFRFNNPDALLVLLLVAASAATLRALESPRAVRWLLLAGSLVGLAFITKMLQAFLVLPALVVGYALFARVGIGRRLLHLLAAFGAMVVAGGWWVAIVSLWPASSRPYIGGSQTNSILELTLGYNGLGRITGNETGSVGGGRAPAGSMWGQTGLTRMFGSEVGGQVAWLLPAALILLLAGLWATRRHRSSLAALVVWGGSLVTTGLVFSLMAGIFHAYYTIALAPLIGAVVAIGAHALWRNGSTWASAVLGLTVIATAGWSFILLERTPDFAPWVRWTVLVVGLAAGGALSLRGRLGRRLLVAAAVGAVVTSLLGPTAYAVQTASQPHSGSLPTAGPASQGGRLGGGPGGPPNGRLAGPRQNGAPTGPAPGGNGPAAGNLIDASTPSAELVATLSQSADSYTWVAAAVGSQVASGYQLATGHSVMPIGGFNGSDPSPTLEQFQADVAAGRIHWFITSRGGFGGPGGSSTSSAITSWVEAAFPSTTVGSITLYDLTGSLS